MFKSFFPNPRLFFPSVLVWSIISVACWFIFKQDIGDLFGLNIVDQPPVIGLGHFTTDAFLLFTSYYILSVGIFALAWFKLSPHSWQYWSILGSAFIMYSTYFSVQVSVALNNWRRPFFDSVQQALTPGSEEKITKEVLYDLIITFSAIAMLAIFVYVITRFFVSHRLGCRYC